MLPNYVEMAKATFVPMEWLLFRGQQCKVFSLIAKKAREDKYVIPVHEKTVKGPKFKGATVIDPMIGMYFEPIAGLDFASLYPSIMMAYNMCYSTIIISSDMMDYVIKNNIPYKTIEWEECTESECKNPKCYHEKIKFSFSFVQIEDEKGIEIINGTRGILGTILLTLMQSRTATKKLMKGEKDPFMYAVLNGKQLAIKVSMNSVYGFTGAEEGIFPCKPIAAGTTAVGREMIEKTSKMTGEEFGGLTIYGDSIFSHELITISFGEITKDIPVEHFSNELSEKWEEYRGFKIGDITVMNKEYKNLENNEYYTLTHKGYQKIKKVIRHKVKGKKMYKITAKDKLGNLHSVSVTEGHSLIGENEELIVAENLKIGDKLYDYQKKKPL
jgi:DNA polymerase elongation subunit (family B)